VARTVLDVAGLPEPSFVNGIAQDPLEGVSMRPSFESAEAPETHDVQYFEMFGNRGLYHRGWTAVTRHSIPWSIEPPPALADDVWELYGPDDWTQARDLAVEHPDKLAEMQRQWLIEAGKYGVLPIDDRRYERINPDLAGRPQLIKGRSQVLFDGMRISEGSVLNVKNQSHLVTAQVSLPDDPSGVLVTQGGEAGGWALYCHEGRLVYCYNFFGIEHTVVRSAEHLPAGEHQLRMEFTYDGGGLARGGDIALYVDGAQVGSGRVERTVPMGFSADEACDVGRDTGSPASPDYGPTGNAFTGAIAWVRIDLGEDDHNHLIAPEDRFRMAFAKQ
jgi:arylsulfatase